MGERKLKIVDVARETGLHRNTVTLLYRETASRIDLDAVDKLFELFVICCGKRLWVKGDLCTPMCILFLLVLLLSSRCQLFKMEQGD